MRLSLMVKADLSCGSNGIPNGKKDGAFIPDLVPRVPVHLKDQGFLVPTLLRFLLIRAIRG
jgi:hypothetical protein